MCTHVHSCGAADGEKTRPCCIGSSKDLSDTFFSAIHLSRSSFYLTGKPIVSDIFLGSAQGGHVMRQRMLDEEAWGRALRTHTQAQAHYYIDECMYVCMYVCMYIYTHTKYIHTCMHTSLHAGVPATRNEPTCIHAYINT